MFEQERKIKQVNTSLDVALPKEFLKEMGLKKGDSVLVGYNVDKNQIEIKPTFIV